MFPEKALNSSGLCLGTIGSLFAPGIEGTFLLLNGMGRRPALSQAYPCVGELELCRLAENFIGGLAD